MFFTKTPCKMDVRKHPRSHIPTSHRAAPRRIWVYLRPSQNGKPDAGTTLIADTRGPRQSELGTSTPAVPPRLRHDAVVNANTGPGLAEARRAGAALRSSVQGSRCWPPPPASWPGAPASSITDPRLAAMQTEERAGHTHVHAGRGGPHIPPVPARAAATLPSARAPTPGCRSSRRPSVPGLPGRADRPRCPGMHFLPAPPHRPHRSWGVLLRGLFC